MSNFQITKHPTRVTIVSVPDNSNLHNSGLSQIPPGTEITVQADLSDRPIFSQKGAKVEVLDNGAKVSSIHIDGANEVSMIIAFNSGSLHERVQGSGVAHMLEHIVIESKNSFTDGLSIREFCLRNGIYVNGRTDFKNTYYEFQCTPDKFEIALKAIVASIFHEPLTRSVGEEKLVIHNEILTQSSERIESVKFISAILGLKKRLPLVIGDRRELKKVVDQDVADYRSQCYCSNNMEISIAGTIDPVLMEEVHRASSLVNQNPLLELSSTIIDAQIVPKKTRTTILIPGKLSLFLKTYVSSINESADVIITTKYALDIFLSSRMRELTGFQYECKVDFRHKLKDMVQLSIGFECSYKDLSKAEDAFKQCIKELRQDGLPDWAIKLARDEVINNNKISANKPSFGAWRLAYNMSSQVSYCPIKTEQEIASLTT